MEWSRRVVVRLLLVGMWTVSLFTVAYPATAQAQGGGGTHTVAAGETLSQIARQYETDVATLLELNSLANANLVHVGQQLVVSGGQNRGGSQQPGWGDEESDSSQGRSERENDGREAPSSEYGNYRQGVAWEPQSPERQSSEGQSSGSGASQRGPIRPGVAWEEPSSEYEDAYEDEQYDEYDEEEVDEYADSRQRQSASRGSNRPEDDWDVESWGQGQNHAGVTWEPEPNRGAGREVEATGEKWIDIDLGRQVLTAYQGDTAVRFFSISSGKSSTPTVTGSFRTYARTEMQDMSGGSQAAGDYYFQADVPWVQYFFEDYAIHGAYWHNRFGTPVGHGCINMRVDESQWLYEWAGATGIRVEVYQ